MAYIKSIFTISSFRGPGPSIFNFKSTENTETSYTAEYVQNKHAISRDRSMSRDHNYFRTWELPRARQALPVDNPTIPNYTEQQCDNGDTGYDTGFFIDHIYQSPDSPTLEINPKDYYELDPESEPFRPQQSLQDRGLPHPPHHPLPGPPKPSRCPYPAQGQSVLARSPLPPGSFTT